MIKKSLISEGKVCELGMQSVVSQFGPDRALGGVFPEIKGASVASELPREGDGRCGRGHLPPPEIKSLLVAIVDDDEAVQAALTAMIAAQASGWAVESYLDADSALESVPKQEPSVVLMDIRLPRISGIECTRRLKSLLPHLPIVVITAQIDAVGIIQSVMAGATGYLLKPVEANRLLSALKCAVTGRPALCEEAETILLSTLWRLGRAMDANGLSHQERTIATLVAQALTDKEVAGRLGIAPGTVHAHLKNIFRKLQVHERGDLGRALFPSNSQF